MNPTLQLHDFGQSLWLDNITRELLQSGTLRHYIDDFSITGLTSNPTIFERAISSSAAYDAGIRERMGKGLSAEALFIELALEDLCAAADLLRPVFEASRQRDGWVSMEISPLLSADAAASLAAVHQIYAQADRPNLLVKIPGTKAGLEAVEEAVFAGVPVNVTLLFSAQQYLAAADAYMRGIERRLAVGLDPQVGSVASLFVSRWDSAVRDKVPLFMHNRLGIAVAETCYQAFHQLLLSPRWRALAAVGAAPQRLLWASTGSKDATAPDILYVEALAVPETINTLPEATLLAFADHGEITARMAPQGGDAEAVLARFVSADIDIDALALRLQEQGTAAFVSSWRALMRCIVTRTATLAAASGVRNDQH